MGGAGEARTAARLPDAAAAVRAVRISAAVEPVVGGDPGQGTVLAVHRSALNLRLKGTLVTVARASVGGLPDGVLVGSGFEPRASGIAPGMTVAVARGSLFVGRGALRVDLAGAATWSPSLRAIEPLPADVAERAAVVRLATAEAGPSGLRDLAFAPFGLVAQRALTGLHDALALDDLDGAREAGLGLIGLGPGLTPSGDDVLVGLSAALTALGRPGARSLATAWSDAAAGRTTFLAEAFHRHAARGEYAERFHDLLGVVLAGSLPDIAPAVRRAAQFGATSGADSLLGLSLGLAATALARSASRSARRPAA